MHAEPGKREMTITREFDALRELVFDVSEVFTWMGNGMEHFFEVAGEQLNEIGAVIMGHRSFDQIYSEQRRGCGRVEKHPRR